MKLYLDTHAVSWLYSGQVELFSSTAKSAIEKSDLLISPIVALELQYLFEIGRIEKTADEILSDLEPRTGLSICTASFIEVVKVASELSWTRDPFDRIIVAQAKISRARLLTKDRILQKHYPKAVW